MSRIDTLIAKLCQKPTPADFRYSDLKKIMNYLGYIELQKGATSGSRVKFYNTSTKDALLLHKPHPGDIMVKGSVESAVKHLKERKLIP